MIGRRGFITGMVSLIAAPAIMRVASIMPVKVMPGLSALDIINQALLDAAERQINPPWISYPEVLDVYGHGPLMDILPLIRFENECKRLILASSTFKDLFHEQLARTTA